jgi:hypothetical protein
MQNSMSPVFTHAVIERLHTSNRSVAVLDLSHQERDEDLINALVRLLLDNGTIVVLRFQDCYMTDRVAVDQFLSRLLLRGMSFAVALPSIGIDEMYRIRI